MQRTPWGPLKQPVNVALQKKVSDMGKQRPSDEFDSLASEIRVCDIEATIKATLHPPKKQQSNGEYCRPSFINGLYDEVMESIDKMCSGLFNKDSIRPTNRSPHPLERCGDSISCRHSSSTDLYSPESVHRVPPKTYALYAKRARYSSHVLSRKQQHVATSTCPISVLTTSPESRSITFTTQFFPSG